MLARLNKHQAGFGLVELLIGLIITMVIVAAAGTVLISTVGGNRDSIRMSRLDQELRQVVTMVSRDLRRATAWDAAADVTRVSLIDPLTLSSNGVGSATVTSSGGNLDSIGSMAVGGTLVYYNGSNVYLATIDSYSSSDESYSVTISTAWPSGVTEPDGVIAASWSILRPQSQITATGTSLLFSYDSNNSGTITNGAGINPLECFGYRYDSDEKAVEIKTADTSSACGGTATWQNLTDENSVEVTAFSVTNSSVSATASPDFNVQVREFTISVTGKLKADPSVERTLRETIRVRNDRLSKDS